MSDKRTNDGGPAFPRPISAVGNCENYAAEFSEAQNGMTLRDWFAGQALCGLMANPQAAQCELATMRDAAWTLADLMVRGRKPAVAVPEACSLKSEASGPEGRDS
jgi:hypothetical protein